MQYIKTAEESHLVSSLLLSILQPVIINHTMPTRSGILLVSLVVVVVCMSQGLVEATDFKCSEFKDALRQHKELL